MTYLEFLILFLIIPITVMGVICRKLNGPHRKEWTWATLTLVILALVYTTPWDNYLVASNVWWYGKDRVLGTIGYVPIEEYLFFILQTVFTGLWFYILQTKFSLIKSPSNSYLRHLGSGFYIFMFLVGAYSLSVTNMKYLGLILVWAIPILILQWAIGGKYLINNFKLFTLSFLPPTIYFWVADALAIEWNIWAISETYTLGLKVGGLPLEEAVFFLVTNLMVAQGLILFIVMRKELQKVLEFKRALLS
ncbi:MAG: lycopene cyclase domain-containing protein [Bacteriovoracaceae bacterium]|nr:lycopene cyclase domain-containing protein [Bacteriovoracaceae bacterium]